MSGPKVNPPKWYQPGITKYKNDVIQLTGIPQGKRIMYFGKGQFPISLGPDFMDPATPGPGYMPPSQLPVKNSLFKAPQLVLMTLSFFDCHLGGPGSNDLPFPYNLSNEAAPEIQATYNPSAQLFWQWYTVDGSGFATANTLEWSDGHIETASTSDPDSWSPGNPAYVNSIPNQIVGNEWGPTQAPIATGPAVNISVPNASWIEYLRLLSIAKETQTALEKLRLNRTWFDIVDFSFNDLSSIPHSYNDNMNCLLFPDPTKPWIGTNFLHLFCGAPAVGGTYDPNPSTLWSPINQFGSFIEDGNPNFDQTLPWLTGSSPRFANYGVQFYALQPGLQEVIIQPSAPTPPVAPPIGDPIYGLNTNPGIPTNYPLQYINQEDTGLEDHASLVNRDANVVAWYENFVELWGKYGFTYPGYTSIISDSATLIRIIAQQFKFDPDTGEDL